MKDYSISQDLYKEVESLGASKIETCMQCGNCSAACSLSSGETSFPRNIYRYLQLGLRDKLLESPEPWLCYYCGDCNTDCPREAEPAETMMATRRWLTTQYDWTGLSKRFYRSEAWEFGALGVVALFVILLFVIFHGPVITDRMAVNTFAPVAWVEFGDITMAIILAGLLLSNGFRMYRLIMQGTKIPLSLYISHAKEFLLHFFTQKRWRSCGENKRRWLVHFILVSGYLTMLTLVIVFLRWLQVDDTSWHISSLFGYYATGTLLFATIEMFRSRLKKQETIHRFSHGSDWLFLSLLFLTTMTGILMHLFRLANWPLGTYVIYVIHLAIAVPMLVVEVPFGKWSHLFYRPFAIFLTTIKAKALRKSEVVTDTVEEDVGEVFRSCMQCGTCTSTCPAVSIKNYSPRLILRNISLDRANDVDVDISAWDCVSCNHCVEKCPRGIGILDLIKSVRRQVVGAGKLPGRLKAPVNSLKQEGTPWPGKRKDRNAWMQGKLANCSGETEYCLFTCCTSAYDTTGRIAKGAQALLTILNRAGVSCGTLGTEESCCGDLADKIGQDELADSLRKENCDAFAKTSAASILTVSPHCLTTFSQNYPSLADKQIRHYTSLCDELITSGALAPIKPVDVTVTYHDPCYLGRHMGIYEAPRKILQAIPGLKLIEMQNSRQRSFCCGGGGGGAFLQEPGQETLGEVRVKEAMLTGAKIIATACPYCIKMLNEAIEKLGVNGEITVADVSELLLRSIDLSDSTTSGTTTRLSQEECHV